MRKINRFQDLFITSGINQLLTIRTKLFLESMKPKSSKISKVKNPLQSISVPLFQFVSFSFLTFSPSPLAIFLSLSLFAVKFTKHIDFGFCD